MITGSGDFGHHSPQPFGSLKVTAEPPFKATRVLLLKNLNRLSGLNRGKEQEESNAVYIWENETGGL